MKPGNMTPEPSLSTPGLQGFVEAAKIHKEALNKHHFLKHLDITLESVQFGFVVVLKEFLKVISRSL